MERVVLITGVHCAGMICVTRWFHKSATAKSVYSAAWRRRLMIAAGAMATVDVVILSAIAAEPLITSPRIVTPGNMLLAHSEAADVARAVDRAVIHFGVILANKHMEWARAVGEVLLAMARLLGWDRLASLQPLLNLLQVVRRAILRACLRWEGPHYQL